MNFGKISSLLLVTLLLSSCSTFYKEPEIKVVTKLESAVETSEASLATLKADNIRLNALSNQLNADLNKSEQYGDELRATLNKHNLTHLANKKPGLIETRTQNATDKLWDDLESITSNTPTE